MFSDKTEHKLKFNTDLNPKLNCSTSDSHNIEQPNDVPLSINLKPNKQRYNDIDDLECVQNDIDLPFERRRRLCRKNYNRNLERVPQLGWKKRIHGFFRDFARRMRIYFST
ncbi:hypothetical protein NPIL_554681 [Nephila pilipes]|uniref:Uncharacterized protein n=1 Tax=Nephila pilipes TaxID=299642 RepID=A0A8X6PHF4_NEPPI|nr:hypothetical protein NPIL_554681 [Nephila pilipes]